MPPPTNTPAPASKASPEPLGEAERRFCGKAGFFRSRHDAEVAIAKSAATDRREPGEGSE